MRETNIRGSNSERLGLDRGEVVGPHPDSFRAILDALSERQLTEFELGTAFHTQSGRRQNISHRNTHPAGQRTYQYSMLSGLPDRPLSYSEVEALAGADAVGFVFPATPNSIREDADGTRRVFDLLISTGETVSAVVYDETDGWIVVGRTDAERPKEEAVDEIIAYRDYEIEDEEKVREFVTGLYGAMDGAMDELVKED